MNCTNCTHCKWITIDDAGNRDYRCDIDYGVLPQVVCPAYKEKE